jgi:hypothetical protein
MWMAREILCQLRFHDLMVGKNLDGWFRLGERLDVPEFRDGGEAFRMEHSPRKNLTRAQLRFIPAPASHREAG